MVAFGLTYWIGVSRYDFVSAPKGYEDEQIVDLLDPKAKSQKPITQQKKEPELEPELEPEPGPEPEPEIVESHLSDYLDLSDGGAEGYELLADRLVAEQKPAHSLVAWERLLDSAKPDEKQVKRALNVLKLHKSLKREDASGIAISIKLHAAVPGDMYDKMQRILVNSARLVEKGSGYSLNVVPEVSVVAVRRGSPRPAVTLWFTGKNESTVAQFRIKHAKVLGLDERVNEMLYNIVVPFLMQHTKLTPLEDRPAGVDTQEALQFLLTRHCWRQFGLLLYKDLKKE